MSKITTLVFRRAKFGFFRNLLGRIPLECADGKRRPKRAGQYSKIISSILKTGAAPGRKSGGRKTFLG